MLLVTIIVCFLEELVGTKEGKALILFYVCGFGKALFLVTRVYWLYIHVHTCLFLQKVNGPMHTFGSWHCALTMSLLLLPCVNHLIIIISPLCLLVPGASAEQRTHGRSKNT